MVVTFALDILPAETFCRKFWKLFPADIFLPEIFRRKLEIAETFSGGNCSGGNVSARKSFWNLRFSAHFFQEKLFPPEKKSAGKLETLHTSCLNRFSWLKLLFRLISIINVNKQTG